MDIKTNISEHKFLVSAENDIVKNGKTEKRCPRCGNEIVIEESGTSYTVKCKTSNCIKADFRGI